jgi:hypothetical protein
LVPTEKLAVDSFACDLRFEPCEAFGGEGLCGFPEMGCLAMRKMDGEVVYLSTTNDGRARDVYFGRVDTCYADVERLVFQL